MQQIRLVLRRTTPITPSIFYKVRRRWETLGRRPGGAIVYDSLSRLTSSTNPETGTIHYSYSLPTGGFCAGDVNLPCSKTDARGVVTSYSYDALSRLTRKTYSDGTHPVAFGYDGTDESGNPVTDPTNAIGRLSRISSLSPLYSGLVTMPWVVSSKNPIVSRLIAMKTGPRCI